VQLLIDQPSSMKRTQVIEQLRMGRWIAGGSRIAGVRTRPKPKWCCQMRLTITRAVSGLSRLAIFLRQLKPATAVLEAARAFRG